MSFCQVCESVCVVFGHWQSRQQPPPAYCIAVIRSGVEAGGHNERVG